MPANDDLSYELSRFGERPRFDDSISQLIRSAERFMALQKFSFAEDQLNLAKTLEPNNAYIWAIQERLHTMKTQQAGTLLGASVNGSASNTHSQRYLSVTVGSEFETGFRSPEQEAAPGPKDLQASIRQFTSVAESFHEKGLHEQAFDSLMKAYLLDPVSPYVVSCERMVLPAWESTRNKAGKFSTHTEEGGKPMNQIQDKSLSAEERKRMDTLKLQKELERQGREREMWRQASSPLKSTGTEPAQHTNNPGANAEAPKAGGLFSKLKLGKFLG